MRRGRLRARDRGALGPLIVAIITGAAWYGWLIGEHAESAAAFAVGLLIAGGIATPIAAIHQHLWRPRFAPPWRQVGALLALVGLFVTAFPEASEGGLSGPLVLWLGVAAVVVAVALGMILGDAAGLLAHFGRRHLIARVSK